MTATLLDRPFWVSGQGEGADVIYLPTATKMHSSETSESIHPSASKLLDRPPSSLSWIADVYSLVARKQPEAATDILFRKIDDWLSADQFSSVDSLLRALDLKRLDVSMMVAILALTQPASIQLRRREAFVTAVRVRLGKIEPVRADRLLKRVV